MTYTSEYGHGGNVRAVADAKGVGVNQLLDFSANINPLGPPDWLRSCLSRAMDDIVHYPDPSASPLRELIARKYRVDTDRVLVANGSTELLYHLPRVLGCRRAVIPVPCYIDYLKVVELEGMETITLELSETDNFSLDMDLLGKTIKDGDLVIIGSPANPTGVLSSAAAILDIAGRYPGVSFVIDEAFLDFIIDARSVAGKGTNIISLHSLTKFYAIPGLRLGYGVFPASVSEKMRKILPPWSVNNLAQEVGKRALGDTAYQEKSRDYILRCRTRFEEQLKTFTALKVFPAAANYILLRLYGNIGVQELQRRLESQNILIRDCCNYQGLDSNFFRVAVRTESENKKLIDALGLFLKSTGKQKAPGRKPPALMFQGTSSNAGKSVLTAALCRILLQDGVRVAPFKAQNMSLNSFVTADGLEMGRAQVVQAQAARLDPDVLMNPILLKPNSDTGSQVIVRGRPLGNMSVMDYVSYKKQAMSIVCDCYDELSQEYQVVILEGAGSPGEVNLKRHDIVNMRMARHAESPVLLVGDIDRGGVYASFVGHMEVLNQWERQLVAGFLVNRFRGNSDLLQDAHEYVKNHTGKDVIGVIPYLHNHGIPEEDSVSFKEGLFQGRKPENDHIEVAIVNLPHISNFTDFEPFIAETDVYLRVVSDPDELGSPDVLILPGSKNVIGDIVSLQRSRMTEAIRNLSHGSCEIVGICGGYQMLGKRISDPHEIESQKGSVEGLGLINMETCLAREKQLTRREGIHIASGQPVSGYEIHHGQTATAERQLFSYKEGSGCGTKASEFNIWGCYLHGIFDSDLFRRWFINRVRKRKDLGEYKGPFVSYDLEPAFDSLADEVRKSIDMDRIYQLLGL